MCGLYTKRTTTDWLKSQVSVLEAWETDMALDPAAPARLLTCVSEHKSWLITELKELGAMPA